MITLRNENPAQQLGKLLEQARLLTKEQFRVLAKRAKDEDRPISEILFEEQPNLANQLLEVLGAHYNVPTVSLREKVITPYVLQLIPKEVAERHGVVVFKKIQNVIHVATLHPDHAQTIDFIRRHTKLEPEVFLTTPEDLRFALRKYGTELSEEFDKIIEDSLRDTEGSGETVENLAQHLPIITMVNSVLERAISQYASDVHFEPSSDSILIRFRIDGLLRKIVTLPKALMAPVVTRLKLMANVKIDEHRIPQDGRFTFEYNDREIAVRASIVPTLHGPKVVLRLLDTKQQTFSLRSLGLNQRDFGILKNEITKPNGMILVTGPTGSGKTTTLYTLLRMLNTEDVNICTVEDPIEYGLDGISQTQINPSAGLTFANGLRSLLRQDPNVIMVGEIRDADTAEIGINAAMTGHLVLSTVHTNSASQTIQRLIEMGVQPYLAASTINVILAQRLVRKNCKHCQKTVKLNERILETQRQHFPIDQSFAKLKKLGLVSNELSLENAKITSSTGCAKCQETGYQGRIGIYEVIPMTEKIHAQVLNNASPEAIQKVADQEGCLTMVDDGLLKVLTGQTSFEEVLRVTK